MSCWGCICGRVMGARLGKVKSCEIVSSDPFLNWQAGSGPDHKPFIRLIYKLHFADQAGHVAARHWPYAENDQAAAFLRLNHDNWRISLSVRIMVDSASWQFDWVRRTSVWDVEDGNTCPNIFLGRAAVVTIRSRRRSLNRLDHRRHAFKMGMTVPRQRCPYVSCRTSVTAHSIVLIAVNGARCHRNVSVTEFRGLRHL